MRFRHGLALLLFLLVITNGGTVPLIHSQTSSAAPNPGTQRFLVQLKVETSPERSLPHGNAVAAQRHAISRAKAALQTALTGRSYQVMREYQTLPFLAIEATPDVIAAITPMVSNVYPDQLFRISLPQSVPLIRADQAWVQGFDGTGSVVAVLDTGVDGLHPFLAGKVVSEACYSGNGNCPNGTVTQVGQGAAVPCAYAPSACRHGTHVAGIAAGRGTTFSGVARGAQIMAIQVFSKFTGSDCRGAGEDPCAASFTSDVMAAMEHVYELRDQYRIAAVNLSLGATLYSSTSQCDAYNAPIKAIIDNLRSVSIATVAAAGNDGASAQLIAPACISSAISVGSTTKSDTISSFSNSASFLSLLAPGSSIQSSVPGAGFAVFSGTSVATPHVAGAWAVMKQKSPQASVTEILDAFVTTGRPVTDSRNGVTKPRTDVAGAIALLGQKPPSLTRRPRVDFDGDGKSDIGIYRAGTWSILRSSDGGNTILGWGGAAQDILVPADYDGDGKTDVAIYRDGTWSILRSSDGGNTVVGWGGAPQDIVVPGDYDGDGKSDIGIYRAGAWSIVRSSDGGNTVVGWGGASQDIVVPADYDGDGKTDIAIYRDGAWSILRSSDGGNTIVGWGGAGGDIPLPADYDGDGKADIAIYRNGVWSIVRSSDGGNSVVAAGGGPQDIPLPVDYDGDGKADIAIYRNGTWIIQRSSDGGTTVVNWGGAPEDVPLK
jgi:subtilisin